MMRVSTGWPALESCLYAETSPIWIHETGSTDAATREQAARLLLMLLDNMNTLPA